MDDLILQSEFTVMVSMYISFDYKLLFNKDKYYNIDRIILIKRIYFDANRKQ